MENYRDGILEDRAYHAAIFFENIAINSLKEIIPEVEISNIPKERNLKTPKEDTQTKHRRKQTFLIRYSGEGVFRDDTILQDMKTPKEDTKTGHRRKQTFVMRNAGEGMFIDDTRRFGRKMG